VKPFLRNIAIFLIIVLLLSSVVQVLIGIRIKNKIASGHDNLDFQTGQYNDLIFLGSSRCFAHFDPALFDQALQLRSVNLGVDGHSELTMHILRLQNYLEKHKAPGAAILNIDPFIGAGSMDANMNFVDKYNFARYAFLPSAANKRIVEYFGFNFAEKYIPLYALLRYRIFFDCLTLPYDKDWRATGYNKHEQQWDGIYAGPGPIESHFFDTAALTIETIQQQLGVIDSICIRHHIRLICVQTPVYKDAYKKDYFSYAGKMCSDLHIPFFDLNDKSIDDSLDNFYNINHMNVKGVAKMTAKLLSDPAFAALIRRDSSIPVQQ
jgi:hypothetical protein